MFLPGILSVVSGISSRIPVSIPTGVFHAGSAEVPPGLSSRGFPELLPEFPLDFCEIYADILPSVYPVELSVIFLEVPWGISPEVLRFLLELLEFLEEFPHHFGLKNKFSELIAKLLS